MVRVLQGALSALCKPALVSCCCTCRQPATTYLFATPCRTASICVPSCVSGCQQPYVKPANTSQAVLLDTLCGTSTNLQNICLSACNPCRTASRFVPLSASGIASFVCAIECIGLPTALGVTGNVNLRQCFGILFAEPQRNSRKHPLCKLYTSTCGYMKNADEKNVANDSKRPCACVRKCILWAQKTLCMLWPTMAALCPTIRQHRHGCMHAAPCSNALVGAGR